MTTQISSILNYLNRLESIDFPKAYDSTRRAMDDILFDIVQHPEIGFKKPNHLLQEQSRALDHNAGEICKIIDNIRQRCRQMIIDAEPEYVARSSKWFVSESQFENAEYIINRKLTAANSDLIEFESRIRRYVSWQYPGMVIRPAQETWCNLMVSMEPLYMVDTHQDLFVTVRQKFTEQYQRRLRYYVIDEFGDRDLLFDLPSTQFALITIWNFLNYKPVELIYRYLDRFYTLLRPGGVVLLTFNDCDREQGVRNCEPGIYMPYTPGSWIIQHAQSLGFEVRQRYQGSGDVAWLELVKPGRLLTMRAASSLATVVEKSK